MTLNDKLFTSLVDQFGLKEAHMVTLAKCTDACEKVCDEFAIAFAEWILGETVRYVNQFMSDKSTPSPFKGISERELLHKFKTEVYGK